MAMHQGQRVAYYIKAALDGIETPIPYRTPFRTRCVPVAQDLKWEQFALEEPVFHGIGEQPQAFPEIEDTYDEAAALREAARCYRCDAETGSTDYAVHHREDLFSMARTHPQDAAKHQAMLQRRLQPRDNPFPVQRTASLDDLVFLPANLSRLVIDPYREACRIDVDLGCGLNLAQPFLVSGLDEAPEEIRRATWQSLAESGAGYLGALAPEPGVHWLQVVAQEGACDPNAAGCIYPWREGLTAADCAPIKNKLSGFSVSDPCHIDAAVQCALDSGHQLMILDGTGGNGSLAAEISTPPRFDLLSLTVGALRKRKKEEALLLVYGGGVRSGTDAARLIALGASAVVYGVAAALAMGGQLGHGNIQWGSERSISERAKGLSSILKANAGEASMMARCTGKTRLHNLEPEDLRSVTLATSAMTGIPVPGHNVGRRHVQG